MSGTRAFCPATARIGGPLVKFEPVHVTIGADGNSRNREARAVNLNPQLNKCENSSWANWASSTNVPYGRWSRRRRDSPPMLRFGSRWRTPFATASRSKSRASHGALKREERFPVFCTRPYSELFWNLPMWWWNGALPRREAWQLRAFRLRVFQTSPAHAFSRWIQ